MTRIFVSHSHHDNQFCRAFVKNLLDIGRDRNLVHCYRVEFNFIQPLLMIEDVIERTQGSRGLLDRFIKRNRSSAQSPQNLGIAGLLSLGFIPLQSGFVRGQTISKGKLMSILQFVYRKVYGDSFIENLEEDRIYKDYKERSP